MRKNVHGWDKWIYFVGLLCIYQVINNLSSSKL